MPPIGFSLICLDFKSENEFCLSYHRSTKILRFNISQDGFIDHSYILSLFVILCSLLTFYQSQTNKEFTSKKKSLINSSDGNEEILSRTHALLFVFSMNLLKVTIIYIYIFTPANNRIIIQYIVNVCASCMYVNVCNVLGTLWTNTNTNNKISPTEKFLTQ